MWRNAKASTRPKYSGVAASLPGAIGPDEESRDWGKCVKVCTGSYVTITYNASPPPHCQPHHCPSLLQPPSQHNQTSCLLSSCLITGSGYCVTVSLSLFSLNKNQDLLSVSALKDYFCPELIISTETI